MLFLNGTALPLAPGYDIAFGAGTRLLAMGSNISLPSRHYLPKLDEEGVGCL